MKSKRYNNLPKNTKELKSEEFKKLILQVKNN